MKRIDAGVSGGGFSTRGVSGSVSELGRWSDVVTHLTGGKTLRPLQQTALVDARVLDSRRHLVVCAPTNSGKSLIGHLMLLDAVRMGRRAVLLEPLRALAREQGETLQQQLAELRDPMLTHAPDVRITTGDYRMDGEPFAGAPPTHGEIVVATPERMEAILRNPDYHEWVSSIGVVVVDEAHLLGDRHRGPTLELLIASLLSQAAPPRIVLLSATLGEPERLQEWLAPCQIVTSVERTELVKQVWEFEGDEDVDSALVDEIGSILSEPTCAVLVFVYRRESTVSFAAKIASQSGLTVLPYHSGQSTAERTRVRDAFSAGACRCVVTTTALAMGVNLPATHVIVRDTTFFGAGKLQAHELLQILGRAGRGDLPGFGAVVVRQADAWAADELTGALRSEQLPPIESALVRGGRVYQQSDQELRDATAVAAAGLVASCLCRAGDDGMSVEALRRLLQRTLGAAFIVPRIDDGLRWLQDTGRSLAFVDEHGQHKLTVLGREGVRTVLPLPYLAGLGQLIRDLQSLDPSTALMSRWAGIDHLLLIALLSERAPGLRRFSEDLAEQIDAWCESRPSPEKGLLFGEWVTGGVHGSRAAELFGSLGLPTPAGSKGIENACRKKAYVAMLGAIVLDERSRGVPIRDVEARWRLTGLGGAEESWRDTALWLLSGHSAVCDVRAFYHHLVEHCAATRDQVTEAKRALRKMRGTAFSLMERLRYCSSLGTFLVDLRQSAVMRQGATVGVGTIRKLEDAGIRSVKELAGLDESALVGLGVQKRYARQIVAYVKRRQR